MYRIPPLFRIIPLVLGLLVLSSFSLHAIELTTEPLKRQEIQRILDSIPTNPPVDSVREQRAHLRRSIVFYSQKTAVLEKERAQLGSALEGVNTVEPTESPASNSLSELFSLKQKIELELVESRLLIIAAQNALFELDRYINARETGDLLYKDEPLWKLKKPSDAGAVPLQEMFFTGPDQTNPKLMVLALLILALCITSMLLNERTFTELQRSQPNMLTIVLDSIRHSSRLTRFMLIGTALLVLLISLSPSPFHELPAVSAGTLIIFFFFLLRLLLDWLFLRAGGIEEDTESQSRLFSHKSMMLSGLSMISALVIVFSSAYAPRELVQSNTLLSSFLFLTWLVVLYLFFRFGCRSLKPSLWNFLWMPLSILGTFLAGLEVLGYRSLIDHMTLAVGYSLVVFSVALLLYDSIDFLMEQLHLAAGWLAHRLSMTPVNSTHTVKTHNLLGFLLKVYIAAGALILIIHQWGITARDGDQLRDFFFTGFSMGAFTISPARVTLALLLFVIGWPAIDYLKQLLNKGWLASAGLSKNDRETFLTISGYLGYAAIIVIGLGVAGVKLTGLTVIIGALSVGIGFGLQNVVNNFISGLILMFEKPIKKGDWILVGTTEGYVKKISIRSTIVQTFDRADVIVPNSELISSQVVNMMFDDQRGRLRVSVGVAYGSDTELVMRLLLEAALSHDQIITDGSAPEPRVLFQAFGDSSLNFDLLVHLKDIDLKMRVRTDLHLMIDKAFREHGVEIPFPQRDIHIKDNQK